MLYDVRMSELIAALPDVLHMCRDPDPYSNDPEDILHVDIMWNDPQAGPGLGDNSRGAGVLFGPDWTNSFLERNDLVLLVRSHQVVEAID
jgi:diadenosine tetraphosphatase ApaH/serine/threonine PP2A family protein phosphatase